MVSPYAALFPRLDLTITETGSELSTITDLGLAILHIQDNPNIGSPTTYCKIDTSNASRGSSRNTIDSVTSPPIARCDTGSVATGSSDDVLASDSEVKYTMREEGLDTPDLEKHIDKAIFVPLAKGPQAISHVSQHEVSPPNVFALGLDAWTLEDTSSEGSFMPETDADSDGGRLAEYPLSMPWQSLEQQDTALVPVPPSKSTTGFTTCAGDKGSSSTSNIRPKSKNHSASKSSSSNHARERMLGNQKDRSADGDDDTPERPRFDVSYPQDLGHRVRLACPFFKHDPRKYNAADHHTCATAAWDSIDRVKQVIYALRRLGSLLIFIGNILCELTWFRYFAVGANKHLTLSPV